MSIKPKKKKAARRPSGSSSSRPAARSLSSRPPARSLSSRPPKAKRVKRAAGRDPAQARVGRATFPVVALGASAGGLAALEAFFGGLPARTGMAYVVVTHQHPSHPSILAELLARRTQMPVEQVTKVTALEADHVYTPAPGFHVQVHDRALVPLPVTRSASPMPIDYLFRSLAQDVGDRAIAIVLSGTGTDGTIGLQDVKAEHGMVMVQDEVSAQYSGMPHSAIATQIVDYVLPVGEMPKQLVEYAKLLEVGSRATLTVTADQELRQVFALIRGRTGHDFAHYKESTIRRRIERRMQMHHLDSLRRYVRFLQTNPLEIEVLFKELLIGVTSFFRDPEAWDALIPLIDEALANVAEHGVFRAWVAGCSTGEEAYSLAILLRERIDALDRPITAQVFATDIDSTAIEVARGGAYSVGIANDISAERLSRFFSREDQVFRIRKDIRELVVFAPQSLIADPPFTKLDLLACRNLLIYLDGELQRRLLPIFHYALKPRGLLFLGTSESIGAFGDLFHTLHKKWKIFRRDESVTSPYVAEFPIARTTEVGPSARRASLPVVQVAAAPLAAERALLKQLVPPTLVVQARGEVVHVHGRTGAYLEPAPGPQGAANILQMAREGLQIPIASALREAASIDKPVVHHGVTAGPDGTKSAVDIRVQRLTEPAQLRGLFLVSFVDAGPVSERSGEPPTEAEATRLFELERELQFTKESHQATIEELETANEELKSTNEEMQSTNEELQSANEELETSKEEMQSLNEELQTVNAELQIKIDELSRANNDMKNLLNGTDIATIFVDHELHIKRFTEQAKRVIRLIPTDLGRPIGDLVSLLRYDGLVDDAQEVLKTLIPREIEVQAEHDAWYLMRIVPYRTIENSIEGLVLTFVDISRVKRLQASQQRLLAALERSPTCAFGHDAELRYLWAFGTLFGRRPVDVEGRTDAELFGAGPAGALDDIKRAVLATGIGSRGRVELPVAGGLRAYDVYVEAVRDASGKIQGICGVASDVT